MLRKIIKIDEEKCNGCGICVEACHEGAIGMVDGVAKLLRDDYCDGLGDCLPACPTNAISFEEREALPYDEEAVFANMKAKEEPLLQVGGCPGSRMRVNEPTATAPKPAGVVPSSLKQWPIQIKLVPIEAPYFNQADVLVAADCCAFAYGNFHPEFMEGKITLIGCPKLDAGDYTEKLTAIIQANDIPSLTIGRMEVPCCGGLEHAVVQARDNSGKNIPVEVVTFSVDGSVKSRKTV